MLFLVYFFYIYFSLIPICIYSANINVEVNTTVPIHVVTDKFLSFALDAGLRDDSANWFNTNFTWLTPISAALGPSYFRFGGNAADSLVFRANATQQLHVFTGYDLDYLYNYSKNSGWNLIFDLNQLIRNDSNWDPSDAQQFIDYASARGYKMDFELGNEPDQYGEKFNKSVTAQQVADGYGQLRALLNQNSIYTNSFMMGPSVASADSRSFLHGFVDNGGLNYVDYFTFHQYYFSGEKETIDAYLNVTLMNSLQHYIDIMKNLSNNKPIWLSETSIDWCGCALNYSSAFIGGFMWLDKLGFCAKNSLDMVIRETMYGTDFSLIANTNKGYVPKPDWWLSFFFKKLIGTQIFNVSTDVVDVNLRLYAASTKNTNGFILYGINVANYSITIDIPQLVNKKIIVYLIKESEPGNLQSRSTTLNGILLEWHAHEPVTNIHGNSTTLPFTLPPYSQFFIESGPIMQCPDGWHTETTFPNKCVKVISNQTLPWFSANFDCTTYGSNSSALSIQNAFENSEIVGLITGTNCNQFYIGLYKNGDNWAWSNGVANSYVNWKSGFPTNVDTQNCAALDAKSGQWINTDCDYSSCYICQQNLTA